MTLFDLLTMTNFCMPLMSAVLNTKEHHRSPAAYISALVVGLPLAFFFGWADYKKTSALGQVLNRSQAREVYWWSLPLLSALLLALGGISSIWLSDRLSALFS
jgi:hypothetical protein